MHWVWGFCTSLKSISIWVLLILEIKSMQISLNLFEFLWRSVEKTWQAQLGICQNQNSHTSNLLPVSLRNSRPTTFPSRTQSFMEMVMNCIRNRSRSDEIESETEICTSLKSKFHFLRIQSQRWLIISQFRFLWRPVRKYGHHNWDTAKIGFCTPLIYFQFASETIAFETTTFLSGMQRFMENCGRNRSTTDQWTDTRTDRAVSAWIIP